MADPLINVRDLAATLDDAAEQLMMALYIDHDLTRPAPDSDELRADVLTAADRVRNLADYIVADVGKLAPLVPPGDGVGDMTPKPATAPEHPPIT
jgi:hypothetical protein